MDKRIKDLARTATAPAGDDFLPLDGATSGTRKFNANNLAIPSDLPTPFSTFVYGPTNGTETINGDIPNNWKDSSDITQLYIGNSATSIGDSAFSQCFYLTGSLTIPNSVTSIGDYAFDNCSGFTGTLIIGNSVTSIGSSAFKNCTTLNGNLTFPNSLVTIGSNAFEYCPQFTGNLIIPNSVTNIGSEAFVLSSFSTLAIINSTAIVGDYLMASNAQLESAYLNQPISSIGSYAFYSCTNLTDIYIGPDATGYTLGAGQSIGGATVTVSEWTNYPNVP